MFLGESKSGRRIKPSIRFNELISDEGGIVDIPKGFFLNQNILALYLKILKQK